MAKYLLSGEGVNWLAIMALLTFFIIFSLVIVMVFLRSKKSYEEVAQLPLHDDSDPIAHPAKEKL